jgi:hypothetical protein
VFRALQVRLRFIVVLAVAFLVVGQWDVLRNRWERLTRGLRGDALQTSVSNDTEYFCPMDPGVLSDWPGKCGVCNMSLVRRKKGEAVPLPSGVVARMQFSPYRLQLAGLQTAPAEYRPLEREVVLVGTVAEEGNGPKRTVLAQALDRDLPALSAWQPAEVVCEVLAGHAAFAAEGPAVEPSENGPKGRLRFVVNDPARELRTGMEVTVRVRRPVAGLEPFRSLPSDPPPLRKGEPRSVYLCPEHAEVLQVAKGSCPVDGKAALEPRPLLANQRLNWWCPMHPTVTADRPGDDCKECGGMRLVPRVVTFRPSGQVLAVPESAVVDTGTRTVVYVERMPGMFDGVEVVLGPRCGDFYPVVRGLEPGQRVASAGAFLIDAETRLNPSLASAYFGAARGARSEVPRGETPTSRAEEPAELRALAGSQKVCPVTGKPLGSMGTPVLVTVKGRSVLICCEGCKHSLQTSPEQYLAKLDAAKAEPPASPAPALPAAARP